MNTPCPCGETCPCHRPKKLSWQVWFPTVLALGVFFGLPMAMTYWFQKHPSTRYIEVNGQMCEVRFKQDGVSSTGAPRGHDVAVCNK